MIYIGINVSFYGQRLITIKKKKTIFISLKSVIKGMGLNWRNQHKKWLRFCKKYDLCHISVATSQGCQKQLMIPLENLNPWLYAIKPLSVKPMIRPLIIKYQHECSQTVFDFWCRQTTPDSITLNDLIDAYGFKINQFRTDEASSTHSHFNLCLRNNDVKQRMQLEKIVTLLDKTEQTNRIIHSSRLKSLINNVDWCYHWFRKIEHLLKEINNPLRVAILDHFIDMYATAFDLSRQLKYRMLSTEEMFYYPWDGNEEEIDQFWKYYGYSKKLKPNVLSQRYLYKKILINHD